MLLVTYTDGIEPGCALKPEDVRHGGVQQRKPPWLLCFINHICLVCTLYLVSCIYRVLSSEASQKEVDSFVIDKNRQQL